MPFVQRDGNGALSGLYNVAQPGYAEEWLPDDDADVLAYRATGIGSKTTIYKADIWRRASDAEAQIIDLQLSAQPIRLRRMWQDSQTLATSDEMYPMVKDAFEQAFGADRAAELLEPTA